MDPERSQRARGEFKARKSRKSRAAAQSNMGGIAAGLWLPRSTTTQKRPITAGGFVDTGPVIFEDITKQAGLSGWRHKMGVPEKKFIVETNGSGVCLIDYDNDGWLDIYLVNGSTFDALDGKEEPPHAALVPQQPRRNVYRCERQGRRDQRPLGLRVLGGRLRQRRLARSSSWATTERTGSTTTITTERLPMSPKKPACTLGNWSTRIGLGRLRWRWAAGPVCHRLCALRPRQPAHRRQQGGGLCASANIAAWQ